MISAVDLLPTFCEIANVTLPKSYHPDGVSQLGALMGDKRPNRDKPLFWKKRSAAGSDRPTCAIVHHKWKMVASTNLEKLELFDIRNDPYEAHDLKEKHPEVVKQLKKQIVNWQASLPEHANPSCFSDFRGKPSLKNTFR
jgi:N-acetylgalactosamine-6-sulfatase